jgi:hypothetical protein
MLTTAALYSPIHRTTGAGRISALAPVRTLLSTTQLAVTPARPTLSDGLALHGPGKTLAVANQAAQAAPATTRSTASLPKGEQR